MTRCAVLLRFCFCHGREGCDYSLSRLCHNLFVGSGARGFGQRFRYEGLGSNLKAVAVAHQFFLSQESIRLVVQGIPGTVQYKVAKVPDPTLYGTAVFILAARADLPAEELRRRFPAQLKIGPVEDMSKLVNLSLPGVSVSPVPVAPRQLPFHAGFVYFELDQSGKTWAGLKSSGALAMHLAGEFPGLELEFWAIRS